MVGPACRASKGVHALFSSTKLAKKLRRRLSPRRQRGAAAILKPLAHLRAHTMAAQPADYQRLPA